MMIQLFNPAYASTSPFCPVFSLLFRWLQIRSQFASISLRRFKTLRIRSLCLEELWEVCPPTISTVVFTQVSSAGF